MNHLLKDLKACWRPRGAQVALIMEPRYEALTLICVRQGMPCKSEQSVLSRKKGSENYMGPRLKGPLTERENEARFAVCGLAFSDASLCAFRLVC